jgi:hypothetical protein
MNRYWSLSSIAHKVTSNCHIRIVKEDSLYRSIHEGKLQANRITGTIRGHGKYPFQVEEQQLKSDTHKLGIDVDTLFPKSD